MALHGCANAVHKPAVALQGSANGCDQHAPLHISWTAGEGDILCAATVTAQGAGL